KIIHHAVAQPGIKILLVNPRHEQGAVFSRDRLQPAILNSPLVKAVLWPNNARRMPIKDVTFANGTQMYVRPAFRTADSVRGISADLLLIEEFEDVALGQLGVIQETL